MKKDTILLPDYLKKIFLNDYHRSHGAKFVPFAGYSMPINYSTGIIKEHLHTRKSVGVFDVSHMGQILIQNTEFNCTKLEKIIPLNLDKLKINTSSYSFILNQEGGIIDDIIISKLIIDNLTYFFIVYNASRKKIDEEIFVNTVKSYSILNDNSLLSIQGPLSSKIISYLFEGIEDMYFMQIRNFIYGNHSIFISRTGYTGEDGFELSIPNSVINYLINDFMPDNKVILCGLGCRDSLRLEAGLSLYGNELYEEITPVEANLSWAVSKARMKLGGFNGHQIISKQKEEGVSQKRVGILSKSKSILRSKMKLYNENNQNIGTITSGGFSPTLNTSIAMAYINKIFLNNSSKILCSIRNKLEEVELTTLPFVKHNYRKGAI